jgi:threonine dehydrogenase-like Zn-dependent dehydrogenase
MRALTVLPGTHSSLRLDEVAAPSSGDGQVLVATGAIGLCGTDHEICSGLYGEAPPGEERLILGHESIGRVVEAPEGSGFASGDWVVGIVRRPDPLPCANCALGEWDMCKNGRYTERGIQARHGFGSAQYRTEPEYLVKVAPALGLLGVLLEPTSVVAKAWEHTARIGARANWTPERALVIGAGPIGLLAALLGTQLGLDVHVLDRVTEGPKVRLVQTLGATYHTGALHDAGADWDVVFECTGASDLLFEAMAAAAPDGIVCLTGVSSGGHTVSVDPGSLNRQLVLENNVVFGSVNANRRHYVQAATALAKADPAWLDALITRRVPVEQFAVAFERQPGDVKTIVTFA